MPSAFYILDSYGLIYRAYYAFINKPLTNKDGTNVSAVFGFFRTFHGILKNCRPEYIAAAFDARQPTFRHKMYYKYKATRQKTPEDLHAQIPVIEEILTALGIPILRHDGYEADDVIATLAQTCRSEKRECYILSGDKDLLQLVDETTYILKPDKSGSWQRVDAGMVHSEWGIAPSQMLDLLSLTGDKSDNVPGIAGIGDKTAQKLLGQYGSLDGIYEHAAEISGALGKKIAEGRDDAYFSRQLITLCSNVPVDTDMDHFAFSAPDYAAASRLLYRTGLPSIAKIYSPDESPPADGGAVPVQGHAEKSGEAEQAGGASVPDEPVKNRGNYRAVTDPAELDAVITDALEKGSVAFDCETTSLNPHTTQMVGFSLSRTKGQAIYVPLTAPDGPLMDADAAKKSLARLFSAGNCTVVTHNGKFDYQVLRSNGLEKPRCIFADTMIAAWLLNPERSSLGLENLAETHLRLKTIAYKDVVPKGCCFADVPLEQAVQYAAEDADLTWQLWELFRPQLEKANLIKLFSDIEMPLLPVLAEMEIAGIHIEKKELADYSVELAAKAETVKADIFSLVGHEFNIASTKQLQDVLFAERKLTPVKKTKTGFSTDTAVLEELASQDPVPAKILEYRTMTKLLSTYVDALPLLADSEGRIHTSFIQTGTATGRLSSRDPNLQNIPVRDEEGRRIRKAFTASKDSLLVSADYSQIELVVLAHLSGDTNLMKAFNEGTDVHRMTAALIFGTAPEDVTPEMRRTAKTINFGVMYGMSAFRLSNELGISRTQAKEFIDSYFATYADVRQFMQETIRNAEKTGYVETILGRRRYIQGISSKNKTEKAGAERMAVNTPIQGSAADIVKMAMLSVSRALNEGGFRSRLLLQVHDELILECPEKETAGICALVREKMEGIITLRVPLRVSVESGASWGDFH